MSELGEMLFAQAEAINSAYAQGQQAGYLKGYRAGYDEAVEKAQQILATAFQRDTHPQEKSHES